MTIDFKRYETFVDAVTSDASKDFVNLADRMVELDGQGANIERLLTAAVGVSAEAGEFTEIVKKMVFQGKPWNGARESCHTMRGLAWKRPWYFEGECSNPGLLCARK